MLFRSKLPHTFPRKNRRRYLILAALALVLNILSYPSCLILFPFALFLLIRLSGKTGWQDVGLFTLICVLCGAGYLAMLFTYTSPSELITTLSHILTGDVTHSLTLHDKLAALLRQRCTHQHTQESYKKNKLGSMIQTQIHADPVHAV